VIKRLRSELEDMKAEKTTMAGQLEQALSTNAMLKRAEEEARKKCEGYISKLK